MPSRVIAVTPSHGGSSRYVKLARAVVDCITVAVVVEASRSATAPASRSLRSRCCRSAAEPKRSVSALPFCTDQRDRHADRSPSLSTSTSARYRRSRCRGVAPATTERNEATVRRATYPDGITPSFRTARSYVKPVHGGVTVAVVVEAVAYLGSTAPAIAALPSLQSVCVEIVLGAAGKPSGVSPTHRRCPDVKLASAVTVAVVVEAVTAPAVPRPL